MIRELILYINPSEKVITKQQGDDFFYLGDNNKITVIPDGDVAYMSISGNVPGAGSYISPLEKQEDGSFTLEGENLNGFLVKVGKVKCNLHITDENFERITLLPFQFESRISFDREATTVAPSEKLTLEEFYKALDILKALDLEEINQAVDIVESLDIEAIEQAIAIVDELDSKVEEVDAALATAKQTEAALNATVADINSRLEAGEFKGETGNDGQSGIDGFSPVITTEETPEGYNITIEDKNDIETIFVKHGKDGIDGKDGTMTFEELTEEQKESLRGEPGPAGPAGSDGQPGSPGADGYTPIRGTDYWTETDILEIKTYCTTYIDQEILGGAF